MRWDALRAAHPTIPVFYGAVVLRSFCFGDVAQLVEHLLCKQGVVGSIPSISTRFFGAAVSGFIYRENRVSVFWFVVPAKVGKAEGWMFAPSFVVEERNVLCQGE
jgi:hypothetical protein